MSIIHELYNYDPNTKLSLTR